MPSATQIRADNLARQTILSAASPLKLFASQSQSADSFSSFEDALSAARTPDPAPQSSPSTSTPAPFADDTQSTQENQSQDEEDNSTDDAATQDAAQSQASYDRANLRTNSPKSHPPSNTPATTAAASPATDPASPAAPTAKSEKKTATAAKPDAPAQSLSTTPAAAALAAQQLAAANSPPIPQKTTPLKPQSTGADQSTAATDTPSTSPAPLLKHAHQLPAIQSSESSAKPLTPETSANKDAQNQSSTAQDNPDPQNPSTPRGPQLQSVLKSAPKSASSDVPPPSPASPDSTDAAPASQSPSPADSLTPALDPLAQSIADSTIAAAAAPTAASAPDTAKPTTAATVPITDGASSSVASTAAQGADSASTAQHPPEIDPEQTFQQVLAGLRGKMDPASGKAEISLNPPNLGALHVSISLSNGSLTAQFQSSSDVVRDLLKTNMEKLKTVLQAQGIAVDKLAVEAPAGKVVAETAKNSNPNSPNNDGRSAGQYTRDQSNPRRSPASHSFARLRQGTSGASIEEAPIDVVG